MPLLPILISIDPLDPDHLPKSLKVLDIVGQQAGDAISQHGGHDIGVMDLFAACLNISHQSDELPSDSSRIVRDFKPLDNIVLPARAPFLWPGLKKPVAGSW